MAEPTLAKGVRCNKWRPEPSTSLDDFSRSMHGTCGPELIHDVLDVGEGEAEALLPMFDFLSHRVGIGFSNVVVAVAKALCLGPRKIWPHRETTYEEFLCQSPPVKRCSLPGCSQCNCRGDGI